MMYNELMKRTNIYLDEQQLRLLKHIAVEEQRSFTQLVRLALQEFLDRYQRKSGRATEESDWNRRLDELLARVRRRTTAFPPEEIEADITAASRESRRRRAHAPRPR
jgi:predicted transcriptional regulator